MTFAITKRFVAKNGLDNNGAAITNVGAPVAGTDATNLASQTAAIAVLESLVVPKTTTVNGKALTTNITLAKVDVGLGNVDNTSDANKPVSTAQQSALNLKANLASPTFTGTVAGVTKSMVGLGNADNTSDVNKPVSTAQQSAIDLKANIASPTFTGTVSGVTKSMVGLSNVDNTSDVNKPVSTAQAAADALKANIASPTFTGTVGGITKSMVGLGNVDNTSDASKSIGGNAATATTLQTPRTINGVSFNGSANITINAGDSVDRIAVSEKGVANGVATLDATGLVPASQLPSYVDDVLEYTNLAGFPATGETGKIYVAKDTNKTYRWSGTAYVYITSGAVDSVAGKTGIVTLVKGDVGLGNVDNTSDANKPVSTAQATAIALKANIASPTFTGTVSGITKSMVGLGNVDNTADTAKPVSTAQQTALDLKANIASPTFTGTVAGITKSMVGLANADNTSDANKPVSTAQQTALDLKANLVSPTFTGTVSGVSKSMVGLANVDNTSDLAKPVSTAQQTALNLKANLDSPALSGIPSAPTAAVNTNTTQVATTAFVNAEIANDAPSKTGGGASGTWSIGVTGNAGTATTLATARTINGVSFNGSANITINAVDSTARIASTEKGAVNGVATLDAGGKVPTAQLPSYVDDVLEYANLAGFPATGETGKIYVAIDTNKTYRWSGTAYVYITSGAVDSVAGRTGVVTLAKGDVGLGNVDNTSDVNKPVSTAQQTALNLKANLASPTLTGVPLAPTASVDTNTTQIATTAYVKSQGFATSSGVTAVSGTAPIVSSGGNTPAISIPAATASVSGHMTSTQASKLDGIATGAQVNVATNLGQGTLTTTTVPLTSSTGTGTTLPAATTTLAGVMSSTDKTKLDGIATGAQVNTVTSVAGKTGAVTLVKADVGLSNVDNTADSTKSVASAALLTTARTIGGISFNGSANIDLPGVNTAGNQNTTGSSSHLIDSNFSRITNPIGGSFSHVVQDTTGALQVVFPVAMTNSMVRVTIKVFEYATNKPFEIVCGGYTQSTGNSWANYPFAYIIGNPNIDRNLTIRFGYTAGGKATIYIGELASAWKHVQFFVTEVQVGYGGLSSAYASGWVLRVEPTAFENVTATLTNVQIGYAVSTNTANSTVRRNASGNFSAGTITATLSGNANTATTLATARTIGGISFNGSANIDLPGVNTAGTQNTSGSAASLTNTRSIAITGDAAWAVNFNGSANASAALTLANSGVAVGTYRSVTVDAKGRVTAGTNPTTISGYGITDAYTKTEIDSQLQGLKPKASVLAASTANIALNTATATLDGVTLAAGSRVLLKNQTTGSQNGIYTNLTTTSWVRAVDADIASELVSAFVFVEQGTTQADSAWVQTADNITLGTTALTWVQFAGAGAYATAAHTHGNITNVGAIGTTANLPIITTTSGVLAAGSFGTAAATFCQGNDSRLSDSRAPTAHTQAVSTISDSTTIGQNLVKLANPSAVTFPRFNADNSITSLNAADFRSAIGAGTSSASGTVTSVGLSLPSIITVSGSPVTGSGTLTGTLATQSGALVFAGPLANTAAPTAAVPTFRNLEMTDIPGSAFKKSCRVATTGAITLNTATATLDGVTLAATDRVLIKDQATASQNGIYYNVTTTTWIRTVDSDISGEIASAITAIDEGLVNGGKAFTNTFKQTDTLGTTAMNWYELLDSSRLSSTVGTALGVAAIGDSTTLARANHVHPFPTAANVGAVATNTAITAGTATKITYDAKGLVTAGGSLVATDIPALDTAKITTGTLATARMPAFTGDATSVAGATALTLANSGVTAGTYRSVTVNAKGLVTAGTNPTTISGYGISDAYTKAEIDSQLQGLKPKASVLAASTANITLNTATATLDGVTLAAGSRVLLKNQTTGSQNGIYTNLTTTSWTRAVDADVNSELVSAFVFVEQGTANKDSAWVQTADNITLGTTALTWVQFAGAGAYQSIITGGATTITGSNLTVSRSLVSDASGKVAVSAVTSTELGYLTGVTSAIQTQIGTKANLASPALTGTPTAPTAAVNTNTTQVATTAFVNAEIANDAPSKTGTGASGTWGISVTGNAATVTNGVYTNTINYGTSINAQTGTAYTTVFSDAASVGNPTALVTMNNAAAQTVTIPPNASVAYPVGATLQIMQIGAGKVTIAPGSGVTLNSAGGLRSIGAQYGVVALVQLSANNWVLMGSLMA